MKARTAQLLTILGIAGMMFTAKAQTTNVILGSDFDGSGNILPDAVVSLI